MIRQSTNCAMDEAFNRLRNHARNHNEGLTDLASRVIGNSILPNDLDEWVATSATERFAGLGLSTVIRSSSNRTLGHDHLGEWPDYVLLFI